MDDHRFDALTRTIGSRRSALAGALGGVAALLGLTVPEEADAHNYLARCHKLRNPRNRRRCLRLAREHNRRHRYCRTVARREACTQVDCGIVRDRCGHVIDCGPCGSFHTCSSNNTCSFPCAVPGSGLGCPAGCRCTDVPDPGTGNLHCIVEDPLSWCTIPPRYCATTTDCRVGFKCEPVPCGPGGTVENRCVSTCG